MKLLALMMVPSVIDLWRLHGRLLRSGVFCRLKHHVIRFNDGGNCNISAVILHLRLQPTSGHIAASHLVPIYLVVLRVEKYGDGIDAL